MDDTVSLPMDNPIDLRVHPDHDKTIRRYRLSSAVIAWLILSLCLIGIMGNLFSIIIYCKPTMRSPINVLLAGLSVVDLFLSIFAIPTFVIPGLYAYYGTSTLRTIMSYCAIYVYPLALTMQTASVWTFVIITVERWQTVCRPGRIGHSPSIRRSLLALILVFLLATAYNAVRFFEFRLAYTQKVHNEKISNWTYFFATNIQIASNFNSPSSATPPNWYRFFGGPLHANISTPLAIRPLNCNPSSTGPSIKYYPTGGVYVEPVLRNSTAYPFYMNFYYIGMFLVTHFIAPFTVLVILNGLIIGTICESRKRRKLLNCGERREHRTAVMIIIVVATFIICYSVMFSLNIMEALDAEWFYQDSNLVLAFALNDVSNLLVVANAASTIIVYYHFSGKYRFMLIQLFANLLPCMDLRLSLSQQRRCMLDEDSGIANLRANPGVHALLILAARTYGESARCMLKKKNGLRGQQTQNGNTSTRTGTENSTLLKR